MVKIEVTPHKKVKTVGTKKEREKKLHNERVKRYYKNKGFKSFSIRLTPERYDLISQKLKEKGISQKQFLNDAIDKFLESNS